jgi:hypothetical protein
MRAAWVDLTKTELRVAVRVLSGAEKFDVEELLQIPGLSKPTHVLINILLNIWNPAMWVADRRADIRQALVIPKVDLFSQRIVMVLPLLSNKAFIAVLRPATCEIDHMFPDKWWDLSQFSLFGGCAVANDGVILIFDFFL